MFYMRFSIVSPALICLFITVTGCSDPEESGRLAREKYDSLKEITSPVLERAKSDGQSFIDGFMKEKEK